MGDMSAIVQRTVETHPRAALAAGAEVMRALSDLDPDAQIAVLRWAQSRVKRRTRNPTGHTFSRERHAVTLGHHDADIRRWGADGIGLRDMAAWLGCSLRCVSVRARILRENAQ